MYATQSIGEVTSYGPVVVDTTSALFLGAKVGSNNTAELSAIGELFLWLLQYAPPSAKVTINFDSKYAANVARGKWAPKTNLALASCVRNIWESIRTRFKVTWKWVKGHTGVWGNEKADEAATLGLHGTNKVGRWGEAPSPDMLYATAFMPPLTVIPATRDSLSNEAADIASALVSAARKFVPHAPSRPKSPWISGHTLSLIDQQKTAIRSRDQEQLADLYKQIRKSARADKRAYSKEQFKLAAEQGEKAAFTAVRRARKGFSPSTTKVVYAGRTYSAHEVHEGLAEYLAQDPWAPSDTSPESLDFLRNAPPLHAQADMPETPFSPAEFDKALSSMKDGKAAGADLATHEMLKNMDERNRASVRNFINKCWLAGNFPRPWRKAIVADIYKGGGKLQSDPASYRPISLLSALYKLYARLLQSRIADSIDDRLRDRQYGFRKRRSYADPVHIVRRVQELYESTHSPLYLVFLDWKQAFDRLSREGLVSSLRRIGFSDHYLKVIEGMYEDPRFSVRDSHGTSKEHKQSSGIRQGCPLSPYLFVIFMSVFMHDVEQEYVRRHDHPPRVHTVTDPLFDLEYADDVLLMTKTRQQMQSLLDIVELYAGHYSMRLNLSLIHI